MCNRLWKTYRSCLAAALLLAAIAPAWAQTTQSAENPRLDHIEDELAAKLPGYVRFELPPPPPPPPVTQPTTQPVPDGDAIAELAATLRAQDRLPTPAEVELCQRWALATGGDYAAPDSAKQIAAGTDLTKLAPGDYAAPPGAYPFPGGRVAAGVRVYAAERMRATVKGKSGQQCRLEGALYGFSFDGGGKPGGDNHNAAMLVGSGARFMGGGYQNAVGVAVAAGQVKVKNGKESVASADDARILGNVFRNNGASGSGGKFHGGELAFNVFDENNAGRDGDGANIGKLSRSDGVDVHHNVCTGGWFADLWADINNGNLRVRDNVLAGCKRINKDYQGVGLKLEISSPNHLIQGNIIYGQHGPAVVLNETRKVRVIGNVLADGVGPEGAVLHGRQLTRADENTNAAVPGSWRLGDVLFDANFLIGGKGRFTRSETGTLLTRDLLRQWGVVIGANNVGTLDIRF
jgi:hypothetical protein